MYIDKVEPSDQKIYLMELYRSVTRWGVTLFTEQENIKFRKLEWQNKEHEI